MAIVHLEDEDIKARGAAQILDYHAIQAEAGLAGWLVKKGFTQTRTGAEKILIGVVAVCITIAILFFVFGGPSSSQELPSGTRVVFPEKAPPRVVPI